MKKTTVILSDDLHRYLVEEAAEEGTSVTALVREALVQHRARHEAQEPPRISAVFGCIPDDRPETDIARTVDESLAEYFCPGGGFGP